MFEEFKKWCAKQSGSYNFGDIHNCALAQFGRSLFPKKHVMGGARSFTVDGEHIDVFPDLESAQVLCRVASFEALSAALNEVIL